MSRGSKGRTIITYKNKLSKLEKIYSNLYRASKKAKEKGKARSFYFHEKYSTFEKYKNNYKIKSAPGG